MCEYSHSKAFFVKEIQATVAEMILYDLPRFCAAIVVHQCWWLAAKAHVEAEVRESHIEAAVADVEVAGPVV